MVGRANWKWQKEWYKSTQKVGNKSAKEIIKILEEAILLTVKESQKIEYNRLYGIVSMELQGMGFDNEIDLIWARNHIWDVVKLLQEKKRLSVKATKKGLEVADRK